MTPEPLPKCSDSNAHAVQGHVRQLGRYGPSLRCSLLGGKQLPVEDKPRLQELPEDVLVHRDVLYRLPVADVVEASFDVPFQDPFCPTLALEGKKQALDCILTGSACAESICQVGRRLAYRIRREPVQGLHGAVEHCRYAHRSGLPVLLGYLHPSEWLRSVPCSIELIDHPSASERDNPFPVKRATEGIQHVSFVFHRSTDDITVVGPEGSANHVFAHINGIGLDPSVLFE